MEDSFTFRLYDSLLVSSTVGVISLSVVSGLKALTSQSQNDSSWICVEDSECILHVYAEAAVASSTNLTIIVSSLPDHGSLLRVNTSRIMSAGDNLTASCSGGLLCSLSVTYRPRKDYFNSPSYSWRGNPLGQMSNTESLTFFAVAENGEYSNKTVQQIQVSNVNDPSDVRCPAQAQYVHAVGTSVFSTGEVFHPLDRISIAGISISDPDEGVDIVKVGVSVKFGLVSLNEDHVGLLDFSSATFCHDGGILQCSGSGSSDRELTFFAEPSHAQEALDGLVYQSVFSDVVDTVNITIRDGANGDCLDETKFRTDSIRRECWRASCTFYVTVQGSVSDQERFLGSSLPTQVWISAIVSTSVLLFAFVQYCSACSISAAHARGS